MSAASIARVMVCDDSAVIRGAIARMLEAGAQAGTLRGDVDPEDVLSTIVGVFLTTPAPEQRAQAGRMLDLLMDGLRAPAPVPRR